VASVSENPPVIKQLVLRVGFVQRNVGKSIFAHCILVGGLQGISQYPFVVAGDLAPKFPEPHPIRQHQMKTQCIVLDGAGASRVCIFQGAQGLEALLPDGGAQRDPV
jgi:hypothetical protein